MKYIFVPTRYFVYRSSVSRGLLLRKAYCPIKTHKINKQVWERHYLLSPHSLFPGYITDNDNTYLYRKVINIHTLKEPGTDMFPSY